MYDKLPSELKENALFCLWRYEERDGNLTKVPYQINGSCADATKKNSQQYKDFCNMYETLTAKIAETAKNEYLRELGKAGIEAIYCPETRYYDVYVTGAQLKSPETLPFGAYAWLLPEIKAE